MSASNLMKIHEQLNSIKNKLNALENNNTREYFKLHSIFARVYTLWKNTEIIIPKTRSRKPAVNLINNKIKYIRRTFKRKAPELSMPNYMELTKMYKNSPRTSPYHIRLNKKDEKSITWEPYYVNNLPIDSITLTTINDGNKAIKINKSIYSKQSFRNLARAAITNVMGYHGNSILFIDPLTKKTVRRSQIEPVTIRKKNI